MTAPSALTRHVVPQLAQEHTFTPRGSTRAGVSVLVALHWGQSGSSIQRSPMPLSDRCLAHGRGRSQTFTEWRAGAAQPFVYSWRSMRNMVGPRNITHTAGT